MSFRCRLDEPTPAQIIGEAPEVHKLTRVARRVLVYDAWNEMATSLLRTSYKSQPLDGTEAPGPRAKKPIRIAADRPNLGALPDIAETNDKILAFQRCQIRLTETWQSTKLSMRCLLMVITIAIADSITGERKT